MKWHIRVFGNAFLESQVTFTVEDNVWWLKLLPNVGGITLSGNLVRLRYKMAEALQNNPTILVHEAVHVIQARNKGLGYLPAYLLQAIKAGFKKANIPMEQEAYAYQTKGEYLIL